MTDGTAPSATAPSAAAPSAAAPSAADPAGRADDAWVRALFDFSAALDATAGGGLVRWAPPAEDLGPLPAHLVPLATAMLERCRAQEAWTERAVTQLRQRQEMTRRLGRDAGSTGHRASVEFSV